MASPVSPTYSNEALNLFYRIPSEQFTVEEYSAYNYTADIRVDKQSEYPDVPASTWTVGMKIAEDTGKVSVSILPKNAKHLECPNRLKVVYKVMWCKKDSVGLLGDLQIESGKCSDMDAGDLDSMAEKIYFNSCPKDHYQMRKDALILVHLLFYANKLSMRKDLKQLLDLGTLSDCTLVCDGQDFPAHRAILAAQSPVFAAMFQNDMTEKSSGVCKVDGISTTVLQMLLQFAYSRASFEDEISNEEVEQLWLAADKYDMEDLRAECERVMVDHIDNDVAFSRLCFAREHKLRKLAVEAAKVIGKNPEETVVNF